MSRLRIGLLALGLCALGRSAGAQDSLATRARVLAASGDFRQAASAWRMVLEARPRDRAALAGLVDALDACGEWRSAIGPLDQLLELGPAEPARLRQRGAYAAWSGERERGLELLRRAVAAAPEDAASLAALAEVQSWNPATREEAARGFAAALARDPGNLTARVGLANLEAWNGHPARALAGYDSVLQGHPDHVGALLGQGAALNQLGHYDAARQALQLALQLSPQDANASVELARADLFTGRYQAARGRLRGRVDPLHREIADSALRATASAAEVSALARRRQNQLDLNQASARLSGALGPLKLFAEYARSEYRRGAPDFSADGYGGGLRLDHRGFALAASGRFRSMSGLPRQWNGSVALGWQLFGGVAIQAGGSRLPVEETSRSVRGELDGGALRGAVQANLAHATLVLDRLPGGFDAEATLTGGRYTGIGLEANARVAVETRAGLVLHHAQPWIRVGYGFSASRFDYNADLAVAGLPAQRGGYFSPAAWWSHQGILQISQRLGHRVNWEADGRLGRQWVRRLEGEASSSRNAAVAHSALTFRLGGLLDLQARFLYVNAFDAFEMKEFSSVLKLYLP